MLHPKSVNLTARRDGKRYMLHITNHQYGSTLSPEFKATLLEAERRKQDLELVGLSATVYHILDNGDLLAA